MREGHCDHDVDSFPVFMLSSAQARACLANRTLLFSGDSYTIQLFVGFADILAGVPNRTEIAGGPLRRRILNRANLQMQELGFNVRFVCQAANECYGAANSLDNCVKCMNRQPADARIIGTTIHLLEHQGLVAAERTIAKAAATVDRLVWVSGPAYNQRLIPYPYNETMPLVNTQKLYLDTLRPGGLLQQANRSISFLDVMGMTSACYARWKNCSADGGHNKRFVERMKATLLLNMLCEPIL